MAFLCRVADIYRQTISTDYTVSVGTAAEMVGHAKQLITEGFDTLKLKQKPSPFEDLNVGAIRQRWVLTLKLTGC